MTLAISCISAVAEESDASTLAPKLDNTIEAALPLRPNPSTNTLTPLKSVTVSLPSYNGIVGFLAFSIYGNTYLSRFIRFLFITASDNVQQHYYAIILRPS
jgi:hypothetical protein